MRCDSKFRLKSCCWSDYLPVSASGAAWNNMESYDRFTTCLVFVLLLNCILVVDSRSVNDTIYYTPAYCDFVLLTSVFPYSSPEMPPSNEWVERTVSFCLYINLLVGHCCWRIPRKWTNELWSFHCSSSRLPEAAAPVGGPVLTSYEPAFSIAVVPNRCRGGQIIDRKGNCRDPFWNKVWHQSALRYGPHRMRQSRQKRRKTRSNKLAVSERQQPWMTTGYKSCLLRTPLNSWVEFRFKEGHEKNSSYCCHTASVELKKKSERPRSVPSIRLDFIRMKWHDENGVWLKIRLSRWIIDQPSGWFSDRNIFHKHVLFPSPMGAVQDGDSRPCELHSLSVQRPFAR